MRTRGVLGVLGALVVVYGVWRITGTARLTRPRVLAEWLIGAVVVHDGILAPLSLAVGFALNKVTAPRARRYIAGALIASALVAAVAAPLIYRRGTQPRSTTLEVQNYALHLMVLVALICSGALVAYLSRVARDRRGSGGGAQLVSDTNERPSSDQVSSTE